MRQAAFFKQIIRNWTAHQNTRSAAAIAFYAVLALAPMLVMSTSIAGYVLESEDVKQQLESQLLEFFGPASVALAVEIFANLQVASSGVLATTISALLLLYGASSMFYQLRWALDQIFDHQARTTRREKILGYLVGRLIAALCVILAGGFLVLTLLSNIIVQSVGDWLSEVTPLSGGQWHLATEATSLVIVCAVVGFLFKLLPSGHVSWRQILPGAAVAVILLQVGKWLIGMYISNSVIASAYGPSSSMVAFVIWIYFSTQILLLGAEISSICTKISKTNEMHVN